MMNPSDSQEIDCAGNDKLRGEIPGGAGYSLISAKKVYAAPKGMFFGYRIGTFWSLFLS